MRKKVSIIFLLFIVYIISLNNTSYAAKLYEVTDTIDAIIYDNGKLVITGTGDIPDFEYVTYAPYAIEATNIKTLEISEGITRIGANSLGCAFQVEEIKVPNSVKSIGEKAFYGCLNLKKVTIGEGVEIIEDKAFSGCDVLERIIFPTKLKKIGKDAFNGCIALEKIDFSHTNLEEIGENAFIGCEGIYSLKFSNCLKIIGEAAFEKCKGLNSIILPGTLECVPYQAFDFCTSLMDITLEEGIKKIDKYAFYSCQNLYSVTFPESIEEVSQYAFLGCSNLEQKYPIYFTLDQDGYYRYLVPNIEYDVYIEKEGWHRDFRNAETAEREISGHKMEALKIGLVPNWRFTLEGFVETSIHRENIGWEEYKVDNMVAGKARSGLRIEAIKIRLTDDLEKYFDVYYRVHIQNTGWLSWAKNDEPAGSSGRGFRIEGIQVVLVKKGENPPEMNPMPNRNEAFQERVNVMYSTHTENIGWQKYLRNGTTQGAPGKHLRIEALKIYKESTTSGIIEYQTHIEKIGWENDWKTEKELSGTSGRGLRLEGIRIKLTGDLEEKFDVYYRIYVEDYGWQGWAKNGEDAGSKGYGKKLEGIEIIVLQKGDLKAPVTGDAFLEK